MEEEKRNIPEVRFREFAGDNADAWELRKFKNFIKKSGIRNKEGANYTAYSVSNTSGLIPQIDQFEESRLSKLDKSDYKLVKPGEFAYNPARINVGSIAFNNLGKVVIVSSLYVILEMSSSLDNEFVLQYIKSTPFLREVRRNTEGSVREYLFFENFKNIRLPYTLNIEEQQKIGIFFKHLDELITLHQRELDNLKALKKTLLSKMFPKNDEKYPEIRFSGFTDAWELRRIGECFDERSSRSENGELISVTINSGVIKANELDRKDISSSNKTNYKVVHTGDIAYNSMRMWQGASGYSPYEGILSPAYTVIKPKENIYSKFFAQYFKRNDVIWLFRINSQGLTSDTWNLKFPALSRIYLNVPNINEQIKIANYFELLDSLITLHQRELDNLKILKKTLLSKMFV